MNASKEIANIKSLFKATKGSLEKKAIALAGHYGIKLYAKNYMLIDFCKYGEMDEDVWDMVQSHIKKAHIEYPDFMGFAVNGCIYSRYPINTKRVMAVFLHELAHLLLKHQQSSSPESEKEEEANVFSNSCMDAIYGPGSGYCDAPHLLVQEYTPHYSCWSKTRTIGRYPSFDAATTAAAQYGGDVKIIAA